MAVLEFEFKGIDQNFRSSASNVLNDIDKIKKAFGSIGVGIGVDLKTALDGQKVALNDTKIQTQELVKAGKELDNQNKQTRNSIAELTLEQKKLTAEQRASRANLQDSPYSKLSRELNEMRNEAKNLGAEMLKLEANGGKTSTRYNELYMKFMQAQKGVNTLDASIKKLDSSLGQNQRSVGNYEKVLSNQQQAQSGANGVAMEFNRIIQDAPFGMMGIGNNIQQLAANWQTYTEQVKKANDANGKFTSMGSLLKGALTSIISPANLLTLAIAAGTSAWAYFTMQQQKANKEAEKTKDKFQELTDAFNRKEKAMVSMSNSNIVEAETLKILYNQATNENVAREKRILAVERMQKLYPKVFENFSKESIMAGKAKDSYLELAHSIELAAKSRAFEEGMSDAYKSVDQARVAAIKLYKEYSRFIKATKEFRGENAFQEFIKASKNANWFQQLGYAIEGIDLTKFSTIREAGEAIQQQFNDAGRDISYFKKELAKVYMDEGFYKDYKGKPDKNTTQSLKDQRDYLLEIQQILQNSQTRVDTSGEILNWDKELIKVHDYYDSQNLALDKMLVSSQRAYAKDSAKRQQIEQAINSNRITLHNNMINELSKIDDKYFSEGMAKVAELNAKYSDSMDLDTRSNALKKVRDEFAKLREEFKNDPIISQEMLDKWQENQTLKVNWEFDNKDLEEWGKLNDKIQETIDKPFNGKNTRSIQAELEKRIDIIKRLLEQLSRATGQPFDKAEFDRLSTELKTKSTEKYNAEQAKKDIQDYVTIANNGLNSVFTNLKSNIDEFGLKARSVFYTIGETLGDLIKQLANKNTAKFMENLTKDAKSFSDLKDNWKNMSSQDKWSAGLGFAGGAVLSMSSPSDSVGQGLGGALSGAAAGTAILPGWGTAIGAVVGGVSGLLKAAKNRRQEKILLEQYEEQKKANRLLERMSALSYASQIIGQKTEYGIVSGVRRNEFGQIVSVVQGQDIIMVADRTNKQKGR